MSLRATTAISMTVAVIATFLALCVALPPAARGVSGPACWLFPYALLFVFILEGNFIVLAIVGLIQFPLYAAIFVYAWNERREAKVMRRIAFLHIILGFGCAWLYDLLKAS